jgi:membrane protease subunit (stomatin/prohibitin family)
MGLFDKVSHELVDIIEWTDDSPDILVWRFPRWQNEIKNGAKLVVRQSQVAVFVNEGKIADVFPSGTHTLETANIPVLSTLRGWKYGFNSPFKVEVYFVNTRQYTDQKWGTKNPIMLNDANFGMVNLRAFGTFAFRVTDGKKFIEEIVGTSGEFTTEEITGQLKSTMISKLSDAIAKSNLGIEKFSANLEEFSQFGMDKLKPTFDEYGLALTKFIVENVSLPEDLQKEIYEYSRLNKIDMAKLAQFKAAKAIEDVAKNPGNSISGAGMGLGMGVGLGNMMGNMMGQVTNNMQQQQQQQQNSAPPPVPGSIPFHIVVAGKDSGALNMDQIAQYVSSNAVTKDTLAWKQGMAGWIKMGDIPELASLFAAAPPPIPS